jgi:hypothetical protein
VNSAVPHHVNKGNQVVGVESTGPRDAVSNQAARPSSYSHWTAAEGQRVEMREGAIVGREVGSNVDGVYHSKKVLTGRIVRRWRRRAKRSSTSRLARSKMAAWTVRVQISGAGCSRVTRPFGGGCCRTWTGATDQPKASARVATAGGARLLAAQDPDGRWGGGVYSPKWTSTTYTLLHLLWLGLPPGHRAALRGCELLWHWQARWRVPETCIVSILIRLTSYHAYDASRLDDVVADLLDQQLTDGGWNCATRTDKQKHSSFNTSIQALEALDAYARAGGAIDSRDARDRGHQFFLPHRLYQSHRTGAVAIRGSTRFPTFPEWRFDVLRGLEYFAAAEAPRDERLGDAIEVLYRARRKDGRWPTHVPYPGRQWFNLEPPGPSRFNTCRALRVLRWWEQ